MINGRTISIIPACVLPAKNGFLFQRTALRTSTQTNLQGWLVAVNINSNQTTGGSLLDISIFWSHESLRVDKIYQKY